MKLNHILAKGLKSNENVLKQPQLPNTRTRWSLCDMKPDPPRTRPHWWCREKSSACCWRSVSDQQISPPDHSWTRSDPLTWFSLGHDQRNTMMESANVHDWVLPSLLIGGSVSGMALTFLLSWGLMNVRSSKVRRIRLGPLTSWICWSRLLTREMQRNIDMVTPKLPQCSCLLQTFILGLELSKGIVEMRCA